MRVVGVDISENNIGIAEAYAGVFDNAEFRVLDIIENADQMDALGVFDVILLPDVIEHIPKDRYTALFGSLERALSPSGRVLLTFPSPGYQEYLRSHHPEHLQVVDETVRPADIVSSTSLELHYYSRRDVWMRKQYVHVVLAAGRTFDPTPIGMTFFAKQRYRIMKRLWRLKNRSFLARLSRPRGMR
ncbi:MAG: class I SAM-dependent methyltransferase [bacterium]